MCTIDVTTVLLVDNHGRSSLGRFLNVKPDLGLITSTARTFIQEGVTTEYATQVLGTTLDNGRLYAHLLTKSSRVLYDKDAPTRTYNDLSNNKKWNIENNLIHQKNFVKNTDFVSPNKVDAYLVFPTTNPNAPNPDENIVAQALTATSEEELLKSSPSNNPYQNGKANQQGNIKVFKISPQMRSLPLENAVNNRENEIGPKNIIKDGAEFLNPSKVRALDNLPTFTVRNEFSPSGYSFLGDLPSFDSNTERSKLTTAADRKAKFLFRAGLMKPQPKDLTTVTYSGFADFTTTVGDTVIIFTPHTSEVPKVPAGHITKISVEPTIRPTASFKIPTLKTIQPQKPTTEPHKSTMVIDAIDRQNRPREQNDENEHEDMKAKSAVLAHEQQATTPEIPETTTEEDTTQFTSPEAIQPSETQIPLLSTPSDEDIAKIVASLQAQAAAQATQPLNTPATIFFDEPAVESSSSDQVLGGATTIFFEDEFPLQTSAVEEEQPSSVTEGAVNLPTTIEMEATTEQTTQKPTEKVTTTTTTERQKTTTQKPTTTTEEVVTEEAKILDATTPEAAKPETEEEEEEEEQDQEEEEEISVQCTAGSQIVPTTTYKTLTYLTTFFIPQDDSTTTSIKSNEVVTTDIEYQTRLCGDNIQPTSPVEIEATTKPDEEGQGDEETEEEEEQTTVHEVTTEQQDEDSMVQETTPMEITTERRHVTESEPETTEMTTENGDELELIFKTLYTTYTYLTTYFQDDTSSIASRIVVTTNVITSTIDPAASASDPAVAGLLSDSTIKSRPITFEEFEEIAPTSVGIGRPTESIAPNVGNSNPENALEAYPAQATPALSDEAVNAVKTYYTTYTYFTTIFVDGETEISSRTEVYTNYVTPSIQPDVSLENLIPTRIPNGAVLSQGDEDLFVSDQPEESDDEEIKSLINNLNLAPSKAYNTTINRQKTQSPNDETDDDVLVTTQASSNEQSYVTLKRGTTENPPPDDNFLDLSEYETISTMVTDVRSSTSEGDRRIIDNVDKRNVLLDDQIVSESNNDSEIIPSPTLLLQTSYTTFTYFTTIYHGTTSSDVVSRLETVTNVVTETLTPTQSLSVEDLSLPVTYFTTFTYWTTLYKDGSTKVTSREETVSNVVTPSAVASTAAPEATINPVVSTPIEIEPSTSIGEIEPSSVVNSDNLTTYFTTYTYYTTSYIGNSTVLKSRLETVTNILNNTAELETDTPSPVQPLSVKPTEENEIKTTSAPAVPEPSSVQPTGLLSTVVSSEVNSGITTIFSTDVFGTYIDGLYAKVLESTTLTITDSIEPTTSSEQHNVKPTGVVSINQGSIVDADGVSTLYYTTKAIGTYIDNLYAQVIESTSSLNVDLDKQSSLASETPAAHKTGLVRLIEGSMVQNDTTTLYQSKVLGTVIDGRYAQIIESTSSFVVGKPNTIQPSPASSIAPTPTQAPDEAINATDIPISPSPVVIEGSLTDSAKIEEESTTEESEGEDEEEEGEDGDNSRTKSRLTFQTRKRTFTPVIRPFVSRPRPTFAPSRKKGGPGSATTITRSDFTPTVTAVPASKPNRFGGRRSSASSAISPTVSSSRRFSRPKSSSAASGGGSSSFGRGRTSSRIQPTSSRRGGFRTSAASAPAPSRPSSSRFNRIRPTLASSLNRSPSSSAVTQSSDENDLTTQVTDNPTDVTEDETDTTAALASTTEGSSRRSQNPLLRFRRPPLARPTPPTRTTTKNGKNNGKNGNRATSTTTTAKPKSAYRNPNLQNRARPNALFPRRNIFTTTTTTPPPEEEEELQEEEELELEEGEGEEGDDTDYEGSDTDSRTENPPESTSQIQKRGLALKPVQIKPFAGLKRRTKRQTNYSRFRRPSYRSSSTTAAPKHEEPETEATTKSATTRGRFSRNRNKQLLTSTTTTTTPAPAKRINPSKASLQGRPQFTLREKGGNTRANFKRPASGGYRTTTAATPARPKAPRLRNSQTEAPSRKSSSKTTSRRGNGRQSSRQSTQRQQLHSREQIDNNFILPDFDGTITVTHSVPTEITIPVVNGKVTEYKNVVTAKYITEVLSPKQYSTALNQFGKEVTVLLSESTDIGTNGETKVTQYTLNETPTTSVIFTPTYIRGRKTSFSHVIPSTVYGVEQVVTTIQPALAAQAPLANILLSQLLLGGLQPQNPLLGLQNPAAPPTPTTEYKTRTTTYVTTVTSSTSTVLPLTFRGKEILTTIIDSSINVVTATEFLTDTIVVTPTVSPNQLNSLLVPLLLQQQQQQQQPQPQAILPQSSPLIQQNPAGVYNLGGLEHPLLDLHQDSYNLAEDEPASEVEEFSEEQVISEEVTRAAPKRKGRKRPRRPEPTEPPKETSVITLYVSGKTPNEFSTVLSTVIVGEEGNKRKREVTYVPVQPSKALITPPSTTLSYLETYLAPAVKDVGVEQLESSLPTESLESIIGDVSKHYSIKPAKASKKYKFIKSSDAGLQKQSSGNFLVL